MQVTVINLWSEPARWSSAAHRFAAAGIAVVRDEAVSGVELTRDETATLYCRQLNRSSYHKALRPGEIGCYASHLAAWRRLSTSGARAMAIFEDDVEFDVDLPEVLEALEGLAPAWDLVKLIGREREKVESRQTLCERRDFIVYRRVPSLTGAYVLSADGARKLLARRQPFGRPVDVDLRHWWECDLVVRGVHPYPAHGAASSGVSTIGEREAGDRGPVARLKKLGLQGRYTYRNWAARRAQRTDTAWPPHALPAASVPRDPALRPPARRRRNLVVLRAGDASLHPGWACRPDRDFDLFVSYYGDTPGRHREGADFYEARRGPKWPGIAELLRQQPQLMRDYEAVWFPDDDLATDGESIDRMFAFVCAYRLCLAQPALTRDSYYTWDTLLQDPRCHIRYTGFVEVMAPVFSRAALRLCAPTFAQSRSGWGLDWVWPRLCQRAGLGRIAILDATPVHHTRPVGGELYRNHPEMDPRADAARVLKAYGVEEVRAVAKYSFEGQVREVDLPLAERLVYWLKRLNGRRKHRAHA